LGIGVATIVLWKGEGENRIKHRAQEKDSSEKLEN